MKSFSQFRKEISEQTSPLPSKNGFDAKDLAGEFKRGDIEYSMKPGTFSATILDAEVYDNSHGAKNGAIPSLKRMDQKGKKGMAHIDLEQEVVWDGQKYFYGYDKKNDNYFRIEKTRRMKASFISKIGLDAMKRRGEWPPKGE